MCVIDLVRIFHWAEFYAFFLAETFAEFLAARVEINQRHVFFRSQFFDRFNIRHKSRIDFSIPGFVPLPANEWGEKDRFCTNRSSFLHVASHEVMVSGVGISLT